MLHRVKKVLQNGLQRYIEVQSVMEVEESSLEPEESCPISSMALVFQEQSLNVWKVKNVEYGISRWSVSWSFPMVEFHFQAYLTSEMALQKMFAIFS